MIMMFAAELMTDSTFVILVDRDDKSLHRRCGLTANLIGFASLKSFRTGTVDADNNEDAIGCVKMGAWTYKEKINNETG